MIMFEKSIQIDRLQQEIFDFVSDPVNISKWQDAIQTAEWTSVEPIGIGSTQYNISRLFSRIFVSILEVTLWDPPNQYIFKGINPFPIKTELRFELKDNSTKVTMAGQAEPGAFFNLPEESFGKQMEKEFETNLEALKLSLETNLA